MSRHAYLCQQYCLSSAPCAKFSIDSCRERYKLEDSDNDFVPPHKLSIFRPSILCSKPCTGLHQIHSLPSFIKHSGPRVVGNGDLVGKNHFNV